MEGYLLAILGIVIICVLVEIILPSGQTAKYIKSLLAIFVVYVLINPIMTLLKSDFDIKKYLGQENVIINTELLTNIYNKQIEAKQKDIENLLHNDGYEGVMVSLIYNIVEEEINIYKVKINIDNLVITSSNQNINKYQYIRQVVMSQLAIKEDDIVFEWETKKVWLYRKN